MKKQLLIIGSLILFPAGLSAMMSRDSVEDEIQGLINELAYHTDLNKQLTLIIAAKDQATQAKAAQAKATQAKATQAKALEPIGGSQAEEEQRLELTNEIVHLSSLNKELALIINHK